MALSDSKRMLLCIAAEVLLVSAVILCGHSTLPSPSGAAEETTAVSETTTSVFTDPVQTQTTAASAITETTAQTTTTTSAAETTTVTTTEETTTTTTTTTTTAPPPVLSPVPQPETEGAEILDEEDLTRLGGTVFVGDSITLGLKTYRVLPADHVLAIGGIGVRNVLEQEYTVLGESGDIVHALTLLRPQYVVFTFGLNDINMTTSEQYCENYRALLTQVHEALPDAVLCADSMTPVLAGIDFTTNTKIDRFNAALEAFAEESGLCIYVDIASALKNPYNSLRTTLNGGDGIHLAPPAYALILDRITETLKNTEAPAENG